MKNRFALLILLIIATSTITACSSSNSSAPPDNQAHPLGWIASHAEDALATAGFADCTGCHGDNLQGSGDAVSCYSCHSFNTTPPFIIHPTSWTNAYVDHRGYAATYDSSVCASCHGSDLKGSPAAPSCFSATFDGRSCHPAGPGEAPHALDGSYLNGSAHGPDAKADLTACQACHAESGDPGTNPRFNIGIASAGGNGCESCHGVNYAHPASWAGPNNTFHYSAGNIQSACTLCHGTALDGAGGVGTSCLECHAEVTNFTLDCTACHSYPPTSHGDVASISSHDECAVCHGMKESATGGFSASTNYNLFDKTTETPGDHWDGNINMNQSAGYDQDQHGCDACHAISGYQMADSGLPVVLEAYGLGDTVPHTLDGSFLSPANHGPAAKGLTAAFPNGLLDCQECHATAGGAGTNPRFNVGITSAGGNGCESCHNDNTAHPSAGTRENINWYDGTYVHSNASEFSTMCALCHGANLEGGVGPACTSCHTVDPVANSTGCVSCHNVPPNGAGLAGNVRPNRQGEHNQNGHSSLINADAAQTCSRCHFEAGVGTANHFDTSSPATVNFNHPDSTDTISATSDASNTTCTGACHLTGAGYDFNFYHDNKSWY